MVRHVVATVDDIAPGQRKLVHVQGRDIGIFNVGGEFFAIANRCPHEGASLCKGRVVGLVESSEPGSYQFSRPGEMVRCPWHGWEFDLRTGHHPAGERFALRKAKLEVADGHVYVVV